MTPLTPTTRKAEPMSTPDFTTWTLADLREQHEHLKQILILSAGQRDPQKPKLRAERDAIRAEIDRRLGRPGRPNR